MDKSKNTNIPNHAQKMAIEHPPAPLMIIAGAGTGKTFTLENRIIYLIQHYKINPSEILAITYTEKAAIELKTRIIHQVGKKAQNMFVGTFHSLSPVKSPSSILILGFGGELSTYIMIV